MFRNAGEGMLIYLPAGCLGARAEAVPRGKLNEGYEAEGVQGLKALGVRDLNYRLAFLACSVKSSNPRVSS